MINEEWVKLFIEALGVILSGITFTFGMTAISAIIILEVSGDHQKVTSIIIKAIVMFITALAFMTIVIKW